MFGVFSNIELGKASPDSAGDWRPPHLREGLEDNCRKAPQKHSLSQPDFGKLCISSLSEANNEVKLWAVRQWLAKLCQVIKEHPGV